MNDGRSKPVNRKTCGTCHTIQPKTNDHVLCLNPDCKHCGTMMSVNHGGCRKWQK